VIDTFVHGALLSLWRSWYLLNKRDVVIHIPSVLRRTCSQVVPSDYWAPGSCALVQIDSNASSVSPDCLASFLTAAD